MSSTRRLTIRFFALLREQAGCRELTLETAAATPAALYAELSRIHGLQVPPAILTFAVNERYVPADAPLAAGDRVTFIPPVAGG
jgi:molybdopterin converting factor subunit 1